MFKFSGSHPFDVLFSRLSDNGAGGGGLVLPGGREDTNGLVVAGETVDTGLDENEAELGVAVLAVALEVLADGDGLNMPMSISSSLQHSGTAHLLDQHVQILRNIGSEACNVSLCQSKPYRGIIRNKDCFQDISYAPCASPSLMV